MSDPTPDEQVLLPSPNDAARRAQRALGAVRVGLAPQVGEEVTADCLGELADGEVSDLVADLVADLMHLARLVGEDVDDALERAQRDYHAETAGTVVVSIDNGYECGMTVSKRVVLFAPQPGADLDAWWNEVVFTATGDPHDCDRKGEKASCEVRVVDAPAHPDLVDATYGWDG